MSHLKTLLFLAASIFSLAILPSCNDDEAVDPCLNVVIPEGWICQDGQLVQVDLCAGVNCPTGFTCVNGNCIEDEPTVTHVGLITADETWSADAIHVLNGKVVVTDGVTLTIDAGTIVKGGEGQGSLATALVVARGGKLMANGTADNPIIMTSVQDNITLGETESPNLDETNAGLWGGLVILGKAPISVGAGTEAVIEGLPADEDWSSYGGSEAADNSGSITYVSVRHGGAVVSPGNEINGITLGGVGNMTTVNHIEVVGNADDGIEFFGGNVNVDNIVIWAQGDDGYDVDQAYSGTINNFVYIAGADSDHGMEIDGPEGSLDGQFTMTNGTMKGLSAEYADFRDGAQANISGVYWFNFDATDASDEFELNNDGTSANYFATPATLVLTGMEFNTALSAADLFEDTDPNGDDTAFETQMAADNTVGDGITKTVGADTSVFGWTLASTSGALDF